MVLRTCQLFSPYSPRKQRVNSEMPLSPPYTSKNPPKPALVSYNGADFHTTFWSASPDVEKRGRIIFVHGFSEQEANYYRIFDDLSSSGYEVFFFDQRGAGHTSPTKTRGHTNEFHVFDDLEFFVEKNIKEIGDAKLFMGGHSMGGGIALNYGINGKHRERLSGIFVTGPLVKVHPDSLPNKIVVSLGKLVLKVWPTMKMNTDLKVENVTREKKWQDFIKNDPLQAPPVGTLRQLEDFLVRGEKLTQPKYAQKYDTVPLLIVHGADDKINDPEATKEFFKLASVEDKKAFYPEKCRHSCFLEEEESYATTREAVLDFLASH